MNIINSFTKLFKDSFIQQIYIFISNNKWLVYIGIFLLVIFLHLLRKHILKIIFTPLYYASRKTNYTYDDKFVKALYPSANVLYYTLLIALLFQSHSKIILKSGIVITIFTFIYNLIDKFKDEILNLNQHFNKKLKKEISIFIIRLLKILTFIIGVSSVLEVWGINITGILASMGLGGLAFALAGKDTASNLLGGISIIIDNIFSVGDWVKIGEIEGIVEDIGMRTTKIRTFYKSIIIVPNSTIANTSIENFTRRKARRIKFVLPIKYNTKPESLDKLKNEILEFLYNEPKIAKDELTLVNFTNLGDNGIDLLIYCFYQGTSWKDYLKNKEHLLINILKIIRKNGGDLAYNSISVYLENKE